MAGRIITIIITLRGIFIITSLIIHPFMMLHRPNFFLGINTGNAGFMLGY